MRLLIVALIVVFLVLQYRLWFGDGSLSEVVQLSAELEVQKKKLKQLEERNRKLEAQVLDLQNGFDAYEEKARNDLGMIKEGETFYQLVGPQNAEIKP
jgi:cell division protein FtsB